MATVLGTLVEGLEHDVRQAVLMRVEDIRRELAYLATSQHSQLLELRNRGWGSERLEAVAALNAFYQVVLGPLASSARDRYGVLGREVPILYGTLIRFDAERSDRLNAAHHAFLQAIAALPASREAITANRASDIVFYIHRALARGDEF